MFGLFNPAAGGLEERGPGWFRPARPVPYSGPVGGLGTLRALRHNLISAFGESDYETGTHASRMFRRQVVVVNEPATIKHVMVTHNENFERKSPQMRRALEPLLGDGLFISDGKTWQHRRPLVTDIVHRNRMPVFGPSMEAAAADMAGRWERRPAGEVFDALSEMAELTAEIIGRAVFGQKVGPAAAREVVAGFADYQQLIDNVNLAYYLGADEGWPVWRGLKMRRAIRRIHKVIDGTIARHLEQGGEEADTNSMVALLARRQGRNPDLDLDLDALRSEAATLFMAGHETTAATLTWAWYLLCNATWVEEAVHLEIERVVGGRLPTVDDVPKLDWCRAVIEETLRLYPPVPILSRQARDADRVGDIEVEPAALVVVVPWLLHRARDLWDRPHDFLPERFIGAARPQPYSYIPFATGPRVCPGMVFGLTEAVLCLATLAQRFSVRVTPGYRVEPLCRLSLRPSGGMPVSLRRR